MLMYKDSRFFIWKEGRDKRGRLRLQLFYPTLDREDSDIYAEIRIGAIILLVLFLFIPILYFFLPSIALLIYSLFPICMTISFIVSFKGEKLERGSSAHFQLIAKNGKMIFYDFNKKKLKKPIAIKEIDHFSAEAIALYPNIEPIYKEKNIQIDPKIFSLYLWKKGEEKPIKLAFPLKPYPHLEEMEKEDFRRLAAYLNRLLEKGLYPQLEEKMLSPWDYISLDPPEPEEDF